VRAGDGRRGGEEGHGRRDVMVTVTQCRREELKLKP